MKLGLALAVTLAAALGMSACGGDDTESKAPAPETAAPAGTTKAQPGGGRTAQKKQGSTVKVTGTRYGRILVDGRGRALYLFTREKGSQSRCYGDCARAWPPLLTRGSPRSRGDARSRLLGTTTRRNGQRQVTYRGHPLYYYVGDREPAEVLCQAVDEFGGIWYVVAPNGNAITSS